MKKRNVLIFAMLLFACSTVFCGCAEKINVDEGTSPSAGPVISNLGPAWVTVSTTPLSSGIISLEVSWTTDVPSTTKLIYYFGSDESTTMYSTEETTLTLTHTVEIVVGSPEFCYRAASKNSAGGETISALDSPVMYLTMGPGPTDADTYLDQTIPAANFGGAPSFQVGDAFGGEFRAALTFDASSIPSNRQVTDSAMILYCNAEVPVVGMQVAVSPQFDPWLEMAANWLTFDGVIPWTVPVNPAPYPAPPAGGGTITPVPVYFILVGGGPSVPGYWFFPGIYSIISTPGVNGIILGYNPPLAGALNFKTFDSKEGANPPQLKLYLVKL